MNRSLELEFLPAALEIEETPPPFAARAMVWAIVAFLAIAIAWATLSHVDIVGVAPGKVVAAGRTKTIQPLENAVVKAIRVTEGEHVSRGQVLVELDPTTAAADESRLRQEEAALNLERVRLKTLLKALLGSPVPAAPFAALDGQFDEARLVLEETRLTRQLAEYRAALAGLVEDRREKHASREAVAARIAQLEATLPLITEEAEANRTLVGKGVVPKVKWLEVERARIAVQQELAAQREERKVLTASLDSLIERRNVTEAQYQSRWMAELTEVETKLASYIEELAKATRRVALTTLTAPVAGTVQQLAVHTEGGVVTEAQPLMLLVPDDAPIEVEARVLNKDIGFVHQGQAAIVKIETFNFTKYGYLEGTVRQVSRDAVIDKDLGLYYLAHIALKTDRIDINGKDVPLEPGMATTVEVKMGERRVIEFLLSPLLRYKHESGRER